MMLSVGLGSALGALVRYLFTTLWKQTKIDWPLATLFINISGAFLLAWLARQVAPNSVAYLFWGVGVMGGYTTFSTMNTELIAMFHERAWLKLFSYLILTYLGGLLAAWWVVH